MNRREFIKSGMTGAAAVALGGCKTEGAKENSESLGRVLPPVLTNVELRRSKNLKGKCAFFFIDDVIWCLRDITRQRPKSMFDHPFLGALKKAHDLYGLKVQLHLFYRTDFFYDADEFTLADVTDAYKAEWAAASDWLKLGFHSLQEFPDYPWINADYEDAKKVCGNIFKEIRRFAGDATIARSTVAHWGSISKDTVRALRDCGVKLVSCSGGPRYEYEGDPSVLPYGHSFRLTHKRKPETALYRRISHNTAITSSLAGYNNLSPEQSAEVRYELAYYYDRDLKVALRGARNAPMLNLSKLENLENEMQPALGRDYVCIGDHEQYFYKDYFAYQPDYADKILVAARLLKEQGHIFHFAEELVD